jgi:hypothetical protein
MKIAAVCCTWMRPRLLAQMVRCFEWQDYPHRELVILDDAGQYGGQQGDRWRLVSVGRRFDSLGAKRNAAAQLVGDDVEAVAVWDDDDLYLPWALSASAAALKVAPWSRPSIVLHPQTDGTLRQHATGDLFHAGWAYRRDTFWQVGGYPPLGTGEDQGLQQRFARAGVEHIDPLSLGFAPFYVYRWGPPGWHLSGMGPEGYQRLGALRGAKTRLASAEPDIDVCRPVIHPEVLPRMF